MRHHFNFLCIIILLLPIGLLLSSCKPNQNPEFTHSPSLSETKIPPTQTITDTANPSTETETLFPTMINPTATTQAIAPSETSRPTHTMLPGTPMGEGVLTDQVGFPMAQIMHSFNSNLFSWFMYDEQGRAVIVYAGVNTRDPEQGELIVVRRGTIWDGIGDRLQIPTRSGRPEITDAVGKRLIILTEGGDTFYFDVPAGKFAPSLTEYLTTMTPGPTLTPRVTSAPLSGDDVSNTRWGIGSRPLNQDLTYFISPGDDEDWFNFYLPSPTDVQISLRNCPAPYSLWVFDSLDLDEAGKDFEISLADKVIRIEGAEAGHYYIRVAALTDAISTSNPYTLRFSTE